MNELKPCPFCGGEAECDNDGKWVPAIDGNGAYIDCDIKDATWWAIRCKECGAEIMFEDCGSYDRDVIRAWNKRADGWISVDDRLPSIGQHVMVSDGIEVISSFLNSSRRWLRWWDLYDLEDITHWQQLPEPLKGD